MITVPFIRNVSLKICKLPSALQKTVTLMFHHHVPPCPWEFYSPGRMHALVCAVTRVCARFLGVTEMVGMRTEIWTGNGRKGPRKSLLPPHCDHVFISPSFYIYLTFCVYYVRTLCMLCTYRYILMHTMYTFMYSIYASCVYCVHILCILHSQCMYATYVHTMYA